MISMIAAVGRNRVIGKDGGIPWHSREDMALFKEITLGKPIVMGRKTFDSIGKALPGRRNVVVSRRKGGFPADIDVASSLGQALYALEDEPEVMIIGGGEIYHQCLEDHDVDRIYLSVFDIEVEDGDVFFPDFREFGEWGEVSRKDFGEFTAYVYDKIVGNND